MKLPFFVDLSDKVVVVTGGAWSTWWLLGRCPCCM